MFQGKGLPEPPPKQNQHPDGGEAEECLPWTAYPTKIGDRNVMRELTMSLLKRETPFRGLEMLPNGEDETSLTLNTEAQNIQQSHGITCNPKKSARGTMEIRDRRLSTKADHRLFGLLNTWRP